MEHKQCKNVSVPFLFFNIKLNLITNKFLLLPKIDILLQSIWAFLFGYYTMLIACCNSKIFMEVISFMNNKNSKVKKIVIAAMAVICAFHQQQQLQQAQKPLSISILFVSVDIQAVMMLLGFQLRRTVLIPMIYLMDIQLFLTKIQHSNKIKG